MKMKILTFVKHFWRKAKSGWSLHKKIFFLLPKITFYLLDHYEQETKSVENIEKAQYDY